MAAKSRNISETAGAAAALRPGDFRSRSQPPPRVVIEGVEPEIDGGRFPAKCAVGDRFEVGADIFTAGHDHLAAVLRFRRAGETTWQETPMAALANDRWIGSFSVTQLGEYEYTLRAWVDEFTSWSSGLAKKLEAGQDVASELLSGAELARAAARRAQAAERDWLEEQAALLGSDGDMSQRIAVALSEELAQRATSNADRSDAADYAGVLRVIVERERARYGAWYEMFPRSAATEPERHGSFQDVEARLPYIADMGFDVLYLPPIHPIGRTHRKGPNNREIANPADPGSPWAIGSAEGGHDAIHPALGTLDDFDRLVAAARDHGLEIALDIAFQCSPDHPYVRDHPMWFRRRADGTIQYAENPPKKYEDIYPLNFEGEAWKDLWEECRRILLFWFDRGVHIFRVDNPHTKPFAFWEWVIAEVRTAHPDVVFLSEAFTRPKVMRYLAKSGFSQSYSYFTWRNTKRELIEYFTELTQSQSRWYMRPNLFANTPDIFHEFLQTGGRPAFQIRLLLAATLGASYGIYGPPFELVELQAIPGTEDYLDSDKYQIRQWDLDRPGNLHSFIKRVNQIRRENPALHSDERLRFHPVDNENLIFYTKTTADLSNIVLVVANLDPHHAQSGWVDVPVAELGLEDDASYQVHDLLGGGRYLWQGSHNYVSLDPHVLPAHIFRVRRRVRTERDFDYFL